MSREPLQWHKPLKLARSPSGGKAASIGWPSVVTKGSPQRTEPDERVVIHQSCRLHEGIGSDAAHELEARILQRLRKRARGLGLDRRIGAVAMSGLPPS
jgi:hypothetical protein